MDSYTWMYCTIADVLLRFACVITKSDLLRFILSLICIYMTHVGIKQISMNVIQRFTTVTNEQPATTQIALTFVGAMEAGLGMVDIVQVMFAYRLLLRVHVWSDRTYMGKLFLDFTEIFAERLPSAKKSSREKEFLSQPSESAIRACPSKMAPKNECYHSAQEWHTNEPSSSQH